MTVIDRGATFLAVLRDMAADEGITDEIVAAARADSPEVARLPIAESRRHIAVLLAAGLAAFERAGDPGERDFAEATRLGADRAAQGVPLAGLLGGVQAGRTRALEIAIERGRGAGIPDEVLVEVLLELDRYTSALERHVIDGYHAAERELARGQSAARTRLLRRLLLGERPEVGPDELARWGLRPDGRYHCLVFGGADPARPPVRSGVFGTVDGRVAGLAPRLPDTDVLVIAGPARMPAEAAAVYRLCVAALDVAAGAGRHGVWHLADLAGEIALAAQPTLSGLLSEALLGRLRPADEFHRELVSTALAYLDHGQRLDHAAAALHVHPNTVRYRLRRLASLGVEVGERLTVLEKLRLWWAFRTWLD
jgi:PucR C-terminal helix-turn-helix domain